MDYSFLKSDGAGATVEDGGRCCGGTHGGGCEHRLNVGVRYILVQRMRNQAMWARSWPTSLSNWDRRRARHRAGDEHSQQDERRRHQGTEQPRRTNPEHLEGDI